MNDAIARLKDWYEQQARTFLLEHEPEKVNQLDADLTRLVSIAVRANHELPVCFLGGSGIGKSTLINALVAGTDVILPAGGVGPLTALAMQVRYADSPSLQAQYHPPQRLSQLLFGLEQTYKRQTAAISPVSTEADDLDAIPDDALAVEIDAETIDTGSARFESLRKQAQLLITGNQSDQDTLEYLLDSLRDILGRPRMWGTKIRDADVERVRRIRQVLVLAKQGDRHERAEDGDRNAFLHDLHNHASGFLAPLIRQLTVYWQSPLLKTGLVLVDLPGVGIAGDVYREVTQKWIREEARAVVLVVNDRGIDDANADLLRTSGFLTRLLFSVDDPKADPLVLAIAVAQLDRIAEARYAQNKTRKKREYLAEGVSETIALLRSQLQEQLRKAWSDGDGLTVGRQRVVEGLVQDVQIYPLSAWEFRRFLGQDDDDRPFIKHVDESGIPNLVQGLAAVAAAWHDRARFDLQEAAVTFRDRVLTTIGLLEVAWQDDRRAVDEADQLRRDLESLIAPLRREFDNRKGAFREFLRTGVPDKIDTLVTEAASVAEKDTSNYLRRLEDAHWATLKAAVVRGGVFLHSSSRVINLPDDIAQRFVEPIAEVWGTRLLQDIRKRTREFADDCVQQVEEVVAWCRENGTRVQPKLLEAQVEAIKADVKQIALVGKEAISDLRTEVKNTLVDAIRDRIKKRCDEFVTKGDAMGPGVKRRILELFADLSGTSTGDAKRVARKLLIKNFKAVEEELRTVTTRFENPLDAAAEAIVESHEQRLKRSDAQRRRAVLASAREILDQSPALDADNVTSNATA